MPFPATPWVCALQHSATPRPCAAAAQGFGSCRIRCDRQGQSVAFAEFSAEGLAAAAMEQLQGYKFNPGSEERGLKVEPSRNPGNKPRGGGAGG